MPEAAEFQKIVLDYFERFGRDFPWRKTADPYEILVSEMMLQQTQTDRVVPKYDAWLARFPDVRSVADSPLADVLAAWSGLGYNRRARFLRDACKIIAHEQNGIFPDTAAALDALPGIGPYTARAITTFAFGKAEVFIETNIRSVFLFHFFSPAVQKTATDVVQPVRDSEILPLIEQTLFYENPRVWYYALMDYGAALKKRVQNPNRASAHYAKQSRFSGSVREARGAILRSLAAPFAHCPQRAKGMLSLPEIAEYEKIDIGRLECAAEMLVAERFIAKTGDLYAVYDED